MEESEWNMDKQSSKSSSLSFTFHKFKNISNSAGTFHISDEVSFVGFLTSDKGDFNLGDTTSRSGLSKKLSDSSLDGFCFHSIIIKIL